MLETSPRHIGDLAVELRINPRTVRYYERIGLMPEPKRSPSGYRRHGAHDAERLRFILKAETIGLTPDFGPSKLINPAILSPPPIAGSQQDAHQRHKAAQSA